MLTGLRRFLRSSADTAALWVAYAAARFQARSPEARGDVRETDTLCLLAWYFPPFVTGGTYRPAALARHLAGAGFSIKVVAGPSPPDPTPAGKHLLEQIPVDVEVYRASSPYARHFSKAVPALDGGLDNAVAVFSAAENAYRAGRPAVIYATGPPFHTFVAGFLLASRYGAKLALEYRDEWTECPFHFVSAGAYDRAWEARCLAAADLVIFTTESQLEHHVRVFSELRAESCRVIPNGWEPRDWDELSVPSGGSVRPTDRPVLSYVGNLDDHTLPEGFLRTLEAAVGAHPPAAGRLELRFVGQKSPRARAQLAEFAGIVPVRLIDHVPRPEANRLMRESAALLLLNPPEFERYLPGKLYEYLASGRPLLVYGNGGEMASLVRRLDAGWVVPAGDPAALAEAIRRVDDFTEDEVRSRRRSAWLERHTREVLSLLTVDALRSL